MIVSLGQFEMTALADATDRKKLTARWKQLAKLAHAEWVRLAKQRLRGQDTRRDYLAGLQPPEQQGAAWVLRLTGKLSNMIERGWPKTDLRTTMLGAGAKGVRTSKKGHRFRYVMFRRYLHGKKVTRHMPEHAAKNIESKIKVLRRVARAMNATTVGAGGARQWGSARPDANGRVGRLTERAARKMGIQKARQHHATTLMAGLYRFEQKYSKSKQNTYGNFRTISTNPASFRRGPHGDKNWIHPGIRARWISRDVQLYMKLVGVPTVFGVGPVNGGGAAP